MPWGSERSIDAGDRNTHHLIRLLRCEPAQDMNTDCISAAMDRSGDIAPDLAEHAHM
jgi:hypothetical protein